MFYTTKYKGYAVGLEFNLLFFLSKCKLKRAIKGFHCQENGIDTLFSIPPARENYITNIRQL